MQNIAAAIAQLPVVLYTYLSKNQKGRFIMKISACFITISVLTIHLLLASPGMGQDLHEKKITLELKNESLSRSLAKIGSLSGFRLAYPSDLVLKHNNINLQRDNRSVSTTLDLVLSNTNLTYKQAGNQIIIFARDIKNTPDSTQNFETYYQLPADTAITGIIFDAVSGQPMENVSVTLKGTRLGTTTDLNGHFRLSLQNRSGILVISFTGYAEQQFVLDGKKTFRVALEKSDKKLDEIVIVGYGTSSIRKNTGSVSSITSDVIARQPVGNPLNTLQGQIAGAVVTQINGLPGSRVAIQIRGVNSLNSGLQPLFVIDGIPFNIQDQSYPTSNDLNSYGLSGAQRGISPFSIINPSDIERIDVLKDADATAIYGTRGANGVVLITTKKGKAGKTKLDVNVYRGSGKVGRFIDMMNTQQYRALRKEAFTNDGLTPSPATAPDLFTWDSTTTTDWQKKYVGGTANITDAQVTVSGGDSRTRMLFNAGYHKETTVFPGDYHDTRFSGRLNVEHNSLDRKFNANVSVNFSSGKSDMPISDLYTASYNLPPNMPLRTANGSLYWNANYTNPESLLQQKYLGKTNNLITNAVLRYTILPGLDLKASLGFNKITLEQNTQMPASSKNPLTTTISNSARFNTTDQETYIVEPQVNYTRDIAQGRLTVLAGSTFQQSRNTANSVTGDNYSNPSLLGTISGAGNLASYFPSYALYKYSSVFGRVTYDWDSKYIVNGIFRRDGSSRFGPGKRFGNFWSVGAAWIFTNEKWVAEALPFLSFGKLRSSYGLTGSDQIQDYQYITLFTPGFGSNVYQGNSVLSPSRINNPNLQWETNKKLEFGADLGFLKDRILLTANYYRNRSGNQLGFLVLASQAGFNSYTSNFQAHIQNSGLEFELNTTNIRSQQFKWATAINITAPSTKLLKADPSYFYYNQALLGEPLSVVFRFPYRGVDQQTGRPLYSDLTKDSLTFTPNFSTDRKPIGYSAPKLYGGITNTLSYKGFELSFFFQFSKRDGDIMSSTYPGTTFSGNQTVQWLNRWRQPGDVAALPKASTTTAVASYLSSSSAPWGDASYIRFRNASLSYSLPAGVVSKLKMNTCRIYIQGQNLYTWTRNKYVSDPETIATINQSSVVMPPLRVLTAGINCSF